MKILLINPPNTYRRGDDYYVAFPLGLAYLASYLENFGHKVSVLDCLVEDNKLRTFSKDLLRIGLSNSEILKRVKIINPDLMGISCSYSVQYHNCKNLAEDLKTVFKTALVVGGAHPSAQPKDVLLDSVFDFVVVGEGEKTIQELADCLENNKNYSGVPGLAFREQGHIKVNPCSPIHNINEIPYPARHLFPFDKYIWTDHSHNRVTKNKPFATMITSRGCPYNCFFCSIHSVWGFKWRFRTAKNVIDEIEQLYQRYNIREIHFEDDNLTLSKKRMLSICNEIVKRDLNISWTTPNGVHVDTLDEELLGKMKESGCYQLALGVESGNPYVLKNLMRKKMSLNKVKEVVKIMRKLNISVTLFFVIGMPGETKENILDTISFAKDICPDEAYFSIATPYPGTDLYKNCVDNGYIKPNQLDLTLLRPTKAVIETRQLTCIEVEALKDYAYSTSISFYSLSK
jgi:magnesium-protoporphyrin IX monomethyl ester (oxidative) cyclase